MIIGDGEFVVDRWKKYFTGCMRLQEKSCSDSCQIHSSERIWRQGKGKKLGTYTLHYNVLG